ncbi:YceH family protein [Shewanella glacialimarina]|jgi:uncharacterized protein YceH (UPF0502 family)|uniref:YceH family protein n=1 Tax=Shewanella glacialimarina TaxID=2590884 RepID=UPI001CF7FA92|nr:DUF480 domain-containing protein [Shewanella glacialimarina]UCX04982.1 DUF480 domain-containing protein [Shewanella glacialimarina]
MELNTLEARVIGCLMEKEITTPDQYPLSLNSITLACNQKSSREPVMSLTESEVQIIIDGLTKKRLLSEQSGFGSRVIKYKHRFCNTEFSDLKLNSAEYALVCVLLLRGAQTPGELKTRTNRLHEFSDVTQVESILLERAKQDKPFIAQLAREAGKRDCRYIELFSTSVDDYQANSITNLEVSAQAQQNSLQDNKIAELEQRIEVLETAFAKLLSQS